MKPSMFYIVRSALIIITMDKETFIKKLTLILEDTSMEYYLDAIYSASEIYFADVIKEEREKAIKDS